MQSLECRGDVFLLLGVCSPFVLGKWSADNTGVRCSRETRPSGTLKPSECAVGSHCADGAGPRAWGSQGADCPALPRCPRPGQGCLPGSAGQEDVWGVSATCASSARAGHVEQQPRGIWGEGTGMQDGGQETARLAGRAAGRRRRGDGGDGSTTASCRVAVPLEPALCGLLCGQEWQPWGPPMGLLPAGSCLPGLRAALPWAPGGALEKGGILGETGPGFPPAPRGLARPVWAQAVRKAGAPLLQALATGSPALSPDPGPAGRGCAGWQSSCELGSPASQGLSQP